MDLFGYSNFESDSFIDSAPPPDFRVQRTPWFEGTWYETVVSSVRLYVQR